MSTARALTCTYREEHDYLKHAAGSVRTETARDTSLERITVVLPAGSTIVVRSTNCRNVLSLITRVGIHSMRWRPRQQFDYWQDLVHSPIPWWLHSPIFSLFAFPFVAYILFPSITGTRVPRSLLLFRIRRRLCNGWWWTERLEDRGTYTNCIVRHSEVSNDMRIYPYEPRPNRLPSNRVV